MLDDVFVLALGKKETRGTTAFGLVVLLTSFSGALFRPWPYFWGSKAKVVCLNPGLELCGGS